MFGQGHNRWYRSLRAPTSAAGPLALPTSEIKGLQKYKEPGQNGAISPPNNSLLRRTREKYCTAKKKLCVSGGGKNLRGDRNVFGAGRWMRLLPPQGHSTLGIQKGHCGQAVAGDAFLWNL